MNSTTVKRSLLGLAVLAVPFLGTALPVLAWDEPVVPLPCDGKSTLTLTNGQSAASRFDNAGHTSATVIVFLDSAKLEQDGHALRHHYSASGPLKVAIGSSKVTISGPDCPPPPPPPVIEVPCGTQWKHSYDPKTQSYVVRWDKKNRSAVTVIISGKDAHTYTFAGTPPPGQYKVRWLKTQGQIDVHHGCPNPR